MKLQTMFGVIPNIKVKGTLSKTVLDLIVRMRQVRYARHARHCGVALRVSLYTGNIVSEIRASYK